MIYPARTRLGSTLASTEERFLAPWVLSDSKMADIETNFRASHRDFFDGDDSMFYAPLGPKSIGGPPTSGTFMQLTMPPD
jgi:hypothetical protein